jgi:hypothetical protein
MPHTISHGLITPFATVDFMTVTFAGADGPATTVGDAKLSSNLSPTCMRYLSVVCCKAGGMRRTTSSYVGIWSDTSDAFHTHQDIRRITALDSAISQPVIRALSLASQML